MATADLLQFVSNPLFCPGLLCIPDTHSRRNDWAMIEGAVRSLHFCLPR